jgi:hypothetical protein
VSEQLDIKRKRDAHIWDRHGNDWYVEPTWCSERLFAVEPFVGSVWDPCCGMGRIPESARAAGHRFVMATDIVDRNYQHFDGVLDFLTTTISSDLPENIVSNPPFGIAEPFVRHALRMTRGKVAMLLPTIWLQGDKRSRWLEGTPFSRAWFITPRPSMPPGEVIQRGESPGNGTKDFCWLIWSHGHTGAPVIGWLRKEP